MRSTTNEKGRGDQTTAYGSTINGAKSTGKSTATEAQYARIVKMLRTGTKTTFDFRKNGIMAPAARIKELNQKHGYYIPTVAVRDLYDDEGYRHPRVAVYELIDEP